jgi:hypothetical protein
VSPSPASSDSRDLRVFWFLRVLESGLLLSSLAGILLFAWSAVDIVRIETAAVRTAELPWSLWPGIFVFLGSMVLLQVLRVALRRYRRDDGSPRADARGAAAAATAEVLASVREETGPAADAADAQGEG